ncbi:hypothetical protein AwErysi_00240 [Erysipelotrichaceae bacterium]|nr:hypothetical protein AwErysi_00240 [Erysipelotrichaceae bacterium]
MKRRQLDKSIGIMLGISLSLTIIGGMLIAFMFVGGLVFIEGTPQKNMEQMVTIAENYENIETVELNIRTENVRIIPSGTNNLTMKYEGSKEYNLKEKNGNLEISEVEYMMLRSRGWKLGWFARDEGMETIEIGLPSQITALKINAGVGTVLLEKITTNTLDIDAGVGTVILKDSQIDTSLNIKSSIGNVELTRITGGPKLSIEGGVGEVLVDEIGPVEAKISSGVGRIKINHMVTDYMEINSGIGTIEINNSKILKFKSDDDFRRVDIVNSEVSEYIGRSITNATDISRRDN